jgi:hypothetical protein
VPTSTPTPRCDGRSAAMRARRLRGARV